MVNLERNQKVYVKHLQEYLDQFTDGKKGNAVSTARVFMQVGGHLEEISKKHQELVGKLMEKK